MLAGGQGLLNQGRVAVMASSNHHRVAAGVGQESLNIGAGLPETELATHVHGAGTAGGDEGVEGGTGFCESRNQHAAGVVSRSDYPQQRLA